MKIKFRFVLMILMSIVFLLGFNLSAYSQKKKELVTTELVCCPFGTEGYKICSAVEAISNKHRTWYHVRNKETPGYVYNLRYWAKNQDDWSQSVVGTSAELEYLAEHSMDPYENIKVSGLKRLNTSQVSFQCFASTNPEITSVEDLKGRRLALGYRGQVTFYKHPHDALNYGYELVDKISISEIGADPGMDALLDGTVDAAIVQLEGNPATGVWKFGPPGVKLQASGKEYFLFGYSKESIENVKKKVPAPVAAETVPKGAVPGLKKNMHVLGDYFFFSAMPEYPDELAYEWTKLWLENIEEFPDYCSTGKYYSKEYFSLGLTQQNAHPGALRAYKEAGVQIPEE